MAWAPGEYYILCSQCQKSVYKSETRRDRNKLLSCINCRDLSLPIDNPQRQLRKDPYPVSKISIEGADVFSQAATWDTIEAHWDTIEETWDEL